MICDGDVIEKYGRQWRVNIEQDDDCDAPWERECGHGEVSEWTTRDKRPGERVLNSDRGYKRYYDAAEANRIAKRDGWGLCEEHLQALRIRVNRWVEKLPNGRKILHPKPEDQWREPTPGDIRAEAVRRDFEYLRRWCNDQWCYVGVVVTDITEDERAPADYGYALWGIESDSEGYIEEVAHGLIDEAGRALVKEAAEAEYWAQRDCVTV